MQNYFDREITYRCYNQGETDALINVSAYGGMYANQPIPTQPEFSLSNHTSQDNYFDLVSGESDLYTVTIKTNSPDVICWVYFDSSTSDNVDSDFAYLPGDFVSFKYSRGSWERIL